MCDENSQPSDFDNAIRNQAALGQKLGQIVNNKCTSKELWNVTHPVILILGVHRTDVVEDYFGHEEADILADVERDFFDYLSTDPVPDQRKTKNDWIRCPNVDLLLLDLKKEHLSQGIHVISHKAGDEKYRAEILRIFQSNFCRF